MQEEYVVNTSICWSVKTNCSSLPVIAFVLKWVSDLLMRKKKRGLWEMQNLNQISQSTVRFPTTALFAAKVVFALVASSFRILEKMGLVSNLKSRIFIMYFHFNYEIFLSRTINLTSTTSRDWCEFHLEFKGQSILEKLNLLLWSIFRGVKIENTLWV